MHSDQVALNEHITITFDLSTSTAVCEFHSQQLTTMKSCEISYGPGNVCNNTSYRYSSGSNETGSSKSSIVIALSPNPKHLSERMHCYIITAQDGTKRTKVEGRFFTGKTRIAIVNICILLPFVNISIQPATPLIWLIEYQHQTIKSVALLSVLLV